VTDLPLAPTPRFGFMASVASPEAARRTAEAAEAWSYDSLFTGDHVAFAVPILDPLLQLAQLGAFSSSLTLGTAVYLLPLRHPVPVAKQVATLDRLVGGRLVFGVGVGGEFPAEYEACGVPVGERGARLSEALPLLKSLWSGESVTHEGRFYPIPPTRMLPTPRQAGGPPLWCGGRSPAALRRIGRLADGWISYVVTAERYAKGLEGISRAAENAGRKFENTPFDTGHLLFMMIDDSYERAWDAATEHLSRRYASDFRAPAKRYAALGPPADVAEQVRAYLAAGVRHLVIDPVGPFEEREAQLERFAREVRPLL
jgi:probable F420-dependent oxidoreductase